MASTTRKRGKATEARGSFWRSSVPACFLTTTILLLALYEWPLRWLISGAPALTFFLLQGDVNGNRVLPFCHVWPLFTTVNLAYAVASTSWLLYWVFAALCYPTIFFTCLFQFAIVGVVTRRTMRGLMKHLHFIDDKIALFDIPALEIDTEVEGLMALRGITFSLSTLTFIVHGVEVGIKLSDDMELAIHTERVTVSLFRGIEVGDCFANLKGGKHEMTFGDLDVPPIDESREALLATDRPIMKAARVNTRPELIKMKSEMTAGNPPEDSSKTAAYNDMKKQPLRTDSAIQQYRHLLDTIDSTDAIRQARQHVQRLRRSADTSDLDEQPALRAAICSHLHSQPSVPHPPRRSVKVTTLRKVSSPRVKRFMHRLPLLLRLLLNPLSYFHPIRIRSVTATASGDWVEAMLIQKIFKDYDDSDSELQRFKNSISSWVSGANFVVGLGRMSGQAHVPLLPSHDILCQMEFDGVVAYRVLPEEMTLNQVVKLRGADAKFTVPIFLLPHHEHLIPELPSQAAGHAEPTPEDALEDGKQASEDVTTVKAVMRAHLPAIFDQDLLDFVASLVKAFKLVEIDHSLSPLENDSHSLGEFPGTLNRKMKDGFKKAIIGGDQWLAKLVGKGLRKLEVVNGDLGYSGEIPVNLTGYRATSWLEAEGEKLLP